MKGILLTGTALASSIAMPFAVSAQTTTVANKLHDFIGKHEFKNGAIPQRPQGLMGKVTVIDGNTITLTHPDGQVITVDASAIGVANIKVGDHIAVEGKVSISATAIHQLGDLMPRGPMMGRGHRMMEPQNSTAQ